jgi:anti-anti-sigma factor
MNIHVEVLAVQVYVIAPQGRLDAVTVPDLEAVFEAQLGAGHVQLVLDLTGVTYLSSSGLRALLRARKLAQAGGGDVVLYGLTPRVREVFEMIGFTSLFQIFEQAAEAAARFPRPATA